MGRTPQNLKCIDCGTDVFKVNRSDRLTICLSCAQTRAIQGALEMANKSGPAWDRWLATNGPRGRPAKPGPTREE